MNATETHGPKSWSLRFPLLHCPGADTCEDWFCLGLTSRPSRCAIDPGKPPPFGYLRSLARYLIWNLQFCGRNLAAAAGLNIMTFLLRFAPLVHMLSGNGKWKFGGPAGNVAKPCRPEPRPLTDVGQPCHEKCRVQDPRAQNLHDLFASLLVSLSCDATKSPQFHVESLQHNIALTCPEAD